MEHDGTLPNLWIVQDNLSSLLMTGKGLAHNRISLPTLVMLTVWKWHFPVICGHAVVKKTPF